MDKLLRAALAATQFNAIYGRIRAEARSLLIAAVAGWIALVFAILALLWFDAALWFYCVPRLGPAIAALIAGGALLLVALVAALVIVWSRSRPARAVPPPPANLAAANAIHELNGFVREHKGLVLIAAALAGVVVGSTPPRRP